MTTLQRNFASFDATAPAEPLPLDVRWMIVTARTVWVALALLLLAAAVLWLARQPLFALKAIQIEGDIAHNNASTLRSVATPNLVGGFFSMDLAKARRAFEAVPWVRHAQVRRVWPNRLAVRLEEHQVAALWSADDGNDKLVNSHGEVFEANVGDVEDDALPRFTGPEASAARMLALYGRLNPVLATLNVGDIDHLSLSGRGSWRAELEGGAVVELGRGSEDEVLARAERFARTVGEVVNQYQRPLEYADLRHSDGYAVRLNGITTTVAPDSRAVSKIPPKAPASPARQH